MSIEKYRVLFIPVLEIGGWSYNEEFDELLVANAVLKSISLYTLMLHEKKVLEDFSNCGWIEALEDGKWYEVDEVN